VLHNGCLYLFKDELSAHPLNTSTSLWGFTKSVLFSHFKVKGEGRALDVAPLTEKNLAAEALRYGTHCRGISQFYLHTHAFIHEWN